jgi:hypothetical protein
VPGAAAEGAGAAFGGGGCGLDGVHRVCLYRIVAGSRVGFDAKRAQVANGTPYK